MSFCICASVFMFACVCVPITTQRLLCFSPVVFSTIAKTGPFLGCLSAANGGAGVGLPGHVSGSYPCQSVSQMHDKTHFASRRTGYRSTIKATRPMWKSCIWNEIQIFSKGFFFFLNNRSLISDKRRLHNSIQPLSILQTEMTTVTGQILSTVASQLINVELFAKYRYSC